MRAGQTMANTAGVEISLFPLEYMNISQGEGGSYSHQGRWAIDFLGWEQMVVFSSVLIMLHFLVE